MLFIADETELKFDWQQSPVQGIYFYQSFMPFHAKMVHVISQLERKYKNTYFYALDAEQFKGSCIRFSIVSVPTVVILKIGKEVVRVENSVKTEDFTNVFADICIQ